MRTVADPIQRAPQHLKFGQLKLMLHPYKVLCFPSLYVCSSIESKLFFYHVLLAIALGPQSLHKTLLNNCSVKLALFDSQWMKAA